MKKNYFILAALLTALSTLTARAVSTTIIPAGDTPVCPSQASAVGFSNLVFDDEFTTQTATGSTSAQSGYLWYPNNWSGATASEISINSGTMYAVSGTLTSSAPSNPTAAQTATGVLTITGDGCLGSVPTSPTYTSSMGHYPAIQGSYQHAYFEARIQVNPNNTGSSGWPSFWSWGTSQFYNSSIYPTPGVTTAENDFIETYPQVITQSGKSYNFFGINTAHTWDVNSNDISNTSDCNYMASLVGTSENQQAVITDGNWHTYGCLWVSTGSTTGYLQYYLDNYLINHTDLGSNNAVTRFITGVGTGNSNGSYTTVNGVSCYTAPEGGLTAQELEHMYMILGCGTGWPINVDWVHVWQTGTGSSGSSGSGSSGSTTGTTTQTVSGFPATLSLSTTQSPYALPATTSAGLTLTYSVASGPATVSGDSLTLTGAGTVVVNASQAGNSTYAAYSGTETITVTAPSTQTVTGFPATLSLSTDQSPYSLPATTSAGLTITYSVSSGPATVSGHALTLTGAGTVVLKATQAGNTSYASYSGTETITVTSPGTQTVSNFPSTLSLTMAQTPYTLPSTTTAGLSVTYTVVSGPASVSGNTLTLTGAGTVVLNASQAGNSSYAAYAGTETISVTTVAQTVSGLASTLSLTVGQSPYTLPSTTSAGLPISYSVTSGPASVSGHTLTLTGAAGTVVLKATQAGNSVYEAFSTTETITVSALTAQTVSSFPSTLSLTMTQTPYTLPATTSAGLALSYSVVSGPATVSGNTLTLTGAGTVVLTASQAGNTTYAPYSGSEAITVTTVAQTVTGFPSALSLTTGESPYALPSTTSAGLTITYSVASGPARVSGNTLTISTAGTVVVNATQAGNATYAPYSGTETITVSALTAQTVSNFPSTQSVTLGSGSVGLPATTSAGQAITYTVVSGPATISGDTLTLTGSGTVVISATAAGNSTYASYSGTETITVTAGATLTFTQWEALYFNSTQLSNATISGATATPENDGVPNLLKYVYDIDPAEAMTANDYAAMPVTDVDTTTTPGTTYLTLTYRQYAKLTGVTVQVQTSPDLQTWTTVTPSISKQTGTDPNTNDPIIEDEVNTNGQYAEFIRLNVTQP